METTFNPGAPVGGSLSLTGPVTSLEIIQSASGNPSLPILYQLRAVAANGTQTTQGFNGTSANLANLSITIFRTDGQPDNCGNPPPVLPPPAPIEIDIDITFDEGDETNITIPFALVFAPVYVALDGTLNIPITLDGPLFP